MELDEERKKDDLQEGDACHTALGMDRIIGFSWATQVSVS